MCIQQIAYPTPFATCRQWRINNGAIGARAPGPRAPSRPRIVNKKNYITQPGFSPPGSPRSTRLFPAAVCTNGQTNGKYTYGGAIWRIGITLSLLHTSGISGLSRYGFLPSIFVISDLLMFGDLKYFQLFWVTTYLQHCI